MGETESAFLHEYCSRGTLHEVLNNDEMELDWVFRLSFAVDAAQGMSYLHRQKITHGRLTTTACIINEQWTLKIKGRF
jgi:serine/threonine protein kinase